MLTYLRTKRLLGAILSPPEPMACPVPERHQKLWTPGLSASDGSLHSRLLQENLTSCSAPDWTRT